MNIELVPQGGKEYSFINTKPGNQLNLVESTNHTPLIKELDKYTEHNKSERNYRLDPFSPFSSSISQAKKNKPGENNEELTINALNTMHPNELRDLAREKPEVVSKVLGNAIYDKKISDLDGVVLKLNTDLTQPEKTSIYHGAVNQYYQREEQKILNEAGISEEKDGKEAVIAALSSADYSNIKEIISNSALASLI